MTSFEAAIAEAAQTALKRYRWEFNYYTELKAYSNQSIKKEKRENIAALKPKIAFLKTLIDALEADTLEELTLTLLQTTDHGSATRIFSTLMLAIKTDDPTAFQPFYWKE